MKEDLLHFIWRCNKLQGRLLTTTTSQNIVIKNPGTLNRYAGPDFFNALVEVNGQLWAGNVEIHLKSSDWYAHHHELDSNYDNVVLHVVWEDDISVFRQDGTQIPTLELKTYVPASLLQRYQRLFQHYNPSFIKCEKDYSAIDSIFLTGIQERLYLERLEQKSKLVLNLLEQTKNNWEAVLFQLLAKNFGTKLNGDMFLQAASHLPYSIIRKERSDLLALESLLFGQFGLLESMDCSDAYYMQLKSQHQYLLQKHNLEPVKRGPEFFGLRPANFPTIRISQLANLYSIHQNLFSGLIVANEFKSIRKQLKVSTSKYWRTRYTFGKLSKERTKTLSDKFIELLIINTLIPLKFAYSKWRGLDWSDDLLQLVSTIKAERNSIITNFDLLGPPTKSALESQAKIQLYTQYCSKNKCLHCAIGTRLLNRNT